MAKIWQKPKKCLVQKLTDESSIKPSVKEAAEFTEKSALCKNLQRIIFYVGKPIFFLNVVWYKNWDSNFFFK